MVSTKWPIAWFHSYLWLLGSGCPPGSIVYVLNSEWHLLMLVLSELVLDDHTAVTITFSQYEASAGPGIPLSDDRKNCAISLNIHVPQGFSFAITDVDYVRDHSWSLLPKFIASVSARLLSDGSQGQSDSWGFVLLQVISKYRDDFMTCTVQGNLIQSE